MDTKFPLFTSPGSPRRRHGFALVRSLLCLALSAALAAPPALAQLASRPLTLENPVTIKVDPVILQQNITLRGPEPEAPLPPDIQVIGVGTESAGLLVQRMTLGLGWYELGVETQVLNALLDLHGLAPDQRSRMMRWERDEVRASCYRRLLLILNKSNRTPSEQGVFDSMTAAVKALHVGATEESLQLYRDWEFAPHLFEPPPGFTYENPPPANHGLYHLLGGPKPPSFDEFKQYGIAVVFAGARDNGELQRVLQAAAVRSTIMASAVAAGGVVGAGAGAALGAALPTVITSAVVKVVAPFAARAIGSGLAAGLSAVSIGASVAGAVIGVVVTSVFEGIAVTDAAQLPGKLAEAVTKARAMTVNLNPLLITDAGQAQIYTAFIKSTLPDFRAGEQAPPALVTDQQWLTALAGTERFRPTPAIQMQNGRGEPISVRLVDGWFVVRDSSGKEVMTLNVEHLSPEGQFRTLTKMKEGYLVTDNTGAPGVLVSAVAYRNWNNQSRLAKPGTGGAQAVISPTSLPNGRVGVPYTRDLSVASPAAGPYTWSVEPGGPGLPPGVSLSADGTVTGTPTAAGTFVFDVYAVNPGGTHPAQQTLSMRVTGDPAPAPANLLSSWLFEDNALDSAGTAHGTWTGGAAYTSGWVGKAASFNGSNHIELPQNVFPPTGPKSFEAWFRTSGAGVILGQTGVSAGYVPAVYVDTSGKLKVCFFWAGSASPITSEATVNNGQWRHVAVTHDGAVERVYLDGALISTRNHTPVTYDSGYRYYLGNGAVGNWPGVNDGHFTGDIDEASLYNRALSAEEVAGLYTAGGAGKFNMALGDLPAAGTVGTRYRETLTVRRNGADVTGLSGLRVIRGGLPPGLTLNPADLSVSGTPLSAGSFSFTLRAVDTTGHSGERTYTVAINGPWRPRPDGMLDWWPGEGTLANRLRGGRALFWKDEAFGLSYTQGLVGQAFTNATYAQLPSFPNIGITGITVETWFRADGECVILGWSSRDGGVPSPAVWVGRDGFVRGDFSNPASASLSKPITGSARVDDGAWHHVAISFGGGEQRLHVDGVLAGATRGLTNTGAVYGGAFTLGGNEPFLPGWPGLPDGSNLSPYLPVAQMDETALYGRVLETAEISGVFASGGRGKPALLVSETTLPAAAFGVPYRQSLTALGASGGVSWSVAGGALPPGLTLSPDGVLSGSLTSVRSAAVSLQVTDSVGSVGVRDYVITARGAPADLPFGAVAWWRGDLNPSDSVGTRHGEPLASGPDYRSGGGGHAFFFNREGASLRLPAGSFPAVDPLAGSRAPYSFETWFLTDRPGVILGRRDLAYPMAAAAFKPALYVGTDGRLRAPMFETDRTQSPPISSGRVDDGRFHHAAVTYDGSALRLHVDGVAQGPVITDAVSRFGGLLDTIELGVGNTGSAGANWPATNGGWLSFYGYIDEPATYSRALSAEEIRAISQAGEIGKAVAPVTNVTLPAGRVGASYLTAALTDGEDMVVAFGGGEMPAGLGVSTEGIVSGIPRSAGPHQFRCGVRRSDGSWTTLQCSLTVEGVQASPVGLSGWYSAEGTTTGHQAGETAVSPNGVNYAAGQVGQAFSLDGVSQHLVMSGVPFPATDGAWSFEVWFRTAAPGVILGQRDDLTSYVPMLYVGADGRLRGNPYWGGSVSSLTTPWRVDDEIFHHAVLTYSNGERRLYLDGEPAGAETRGGVVYAPAYRYTIGTGTVADWPSAPANRFFTGLIDEPQFYTRALSPAEARRGFTAGKLGRSPMALDNTLTDTTAGTGPYDAQITATGGIGPHTFAVAEGRLPAGLTLSPQGRLAGAVTQASGIFQFAIEATSATGAKSIRDYQIISRPNMRYRPAGVRAWWSANGNTDDWTGAHTATAFSNVAGDPFTYAEGVTGQSFNFRGLGMTSSFGLPFIKEGVQLPGSAFPAVDQREPFSLELWFRATEPGGLLGQSNQPVLGPLTLPMLYIDTAGYLRAQIGWTATPSQVVSPGIVLDDTWHHVAATLDAAGNMRVYLDGALIGSRAGIGPMVRDARSLFVLGHVLAPGWPLSGDSANGVTFTGRIDEVSTWSRVLTQEEILRLLACGPNGKASLAITPGGELPFALWHVALTQPLAVSGQAGPRFSLASGALPPGLSLSTAESVNPPVSGLFGVPSETGSWEFTLSNVPLPGPLAGREQVDERFRLDVDLSLAYREWADADGGLQGAARQPLASPYADSVNFLKYAFNLRPTAGDSRVLTGGGSGSGLPYITRNSSGRLVIEFLRRRAASHPRLTYGVVTGPDLNALAPLSLSEAVVTPIDAAWERVTVTDSVITPGRFGRVVVDQN